MESPVVVISIVVALLGLCLLVMWAPLISKKKSQNSIRSISRSVKGHPPVDVASGIIFNHDVSGGHNSGCD